METNDQITDKGIVMKDAPTTSRIHFPLWKHGRGIYDTFIIWVPKHEISDYDPRGGRPVETYSRTTAIGGYENENRTEKRAA